MSKFDQFIEDFDKRLNKDTSTISTLSSPTDSQFDHTSINNKVQADQESSHQFKPSTPNLNSSSTVTLKPNTQSTPTKVHKNSVSYHPLSPVSNSSQNGGNGGTGSSRKKGLNLNIAMSSKNSTPKKQPNSSMDTKDRESDMNDVLRKMASSEIKIIELKDELKLIQQKIQLEEEELTRLRNKVARNINQPKIKKQISSPLKSSFSPDKSIKSHRSTSSTSSTSSQAHSTSSNPQQQDAANQSYWSKPMNLLNQFDQLLQNEFEKLGKDTNEKDDVLKGVSNSLWGFLGDVKSGLMGDETTSHAQYQGYNPHGSNQRSRSNTQRQRGGSHSHGSNHNDTTLNSNSKDNAKESSDEEDLGLGLQKIQIHDNQGLRNGSEEELIDFKDVRLKNGDQGQDQQGNDQNYIDKGKDNI